MAEALEPRSNFRIARLTEQDARRMSDHLLWFRELVLENDPMYPGIQKTGYPLGSTSPYPWGLMRLWYGCGSTCTACWTNR